MSETLEAALSHFASERGFIGKGALCVALVVTDHARKNGLPLNSDDLVTEGGGQVLGLGKGPVQTILKRHDINRVLAAEGGRTSRGSLNNMRQYVAWLNERNDRAGMDIDVVERYWIGRVKEFFAGEPFTVRLDASHGLRHVIADLLGQAVARQREAVGVHYAGAVLQHLVGARLECALGLGNVEHNSFSTADAPLNRPGDFVVGDTAIHVTTAPGEAVIKRCRDNLDAGKRPILVTTRSNLSVAEGLAENDGLRSRIDIFDIEQFMAAKIHEIGRFASEGRRSALDQFVLTYNRIIDDVETDPSLKLALAA